MLAAIDFGISNTDAVSLRNGIPRYWTREARGAPDASMVRDVLSAGDVSLATLPRIAVTGGRHKILPTLLGECVVVPVPEVTAIGRGGQALGFPDESNPTTPMLVVSAGSGTAVISARGTEYAHITGTGVGGGTLLGLGRLLLGTTEVTLIDAMAMRGDPNGVDLALRDVVSGPIGSLPPDATAVNFGRLARQETLARPDDLAAALMTLVGQVIAITAINAARAERVERVVLIGHMADMPSFRRVIAQVGEYYGMHVLVPEHAGYGTALGALLHAGAHTA
ncbi:MAG: Fumble domain-containing protein [Gemmatimonadaceae bacterium]|nr:Fumble domain-containing protein [Gemmatimonadaceae bacterium]